jgi:hypothetical protein
MAGKKDHRKTKSPLRERPLRTAGQSLQEEAERFMDEDVLRWLIAATFCLVLAGLEWARWLFKWPPQPVPITLLAIVLGLLCLRRLVKARAYLGQLRQGREGEMTVAQMLDDLRVHGFHVFHDIVRGSYNIDHVVVGPTGVYAIETKTPSKPTDHDAKVVYDGERVIVAGRSPDRDPIAQALASADSTRDLLASATGLRPMVRPVVVYPGWRVEGEEANRSARVWVLNAKRLLGWIKNERADLPADQVAAFSAALDAHARSSGQDK